MVLMYRVLEYCQLCISRETVPLLYRCSGDITEESITGFVLANSMPLVVDFNQVFVDHFYQDNIH